MPEGASLLALVAVVYLSFPKLLFGVKRSHFGVITDPSVAIT
jgi:hypothetical protein